MRTWKIFVVNHSHTDIGYTERQEKLKRYHRDFVLQALTLLDDIDAGRRPGCEGFTWQLENFWQVENFLQGATAAQCQALAARIREGRIGISGNYLNATELLDETVLDLCLRRAEEYGERIGYPVRSGMSADINGYAWGYPTALAKAGVENLYCALHPHHGMFPLYRKQQPFYWQGPDGKRVLTWVGEHYHFGNELFFAPHGGTSYMLFDDVRQEMNSGRILSTDAATTHGEEVDAMCRRVERYLANLDKEGYPFDVVPVLVSGAITDNAPPSAEIAARLQELNAAFAGKISAQMATLDDFFAAIRESNVEIPTFSGDFTDWWADGVGSTPAAVKLYREAQRKRNLCVKLDPAGKLGDGELMRRASDDMMLYAEHTWGYSSSVSEPWDTLVASLEKKKDAYAINANTEIAENLDKVLAALGEVSISVDRAQRFRVINPHAQTLHATVRLYVEYWEYMEGVRFDPLAHLVLTDEATGAEIPCQGRAIARAYEIEACLKMAPGESRTLRLRQVRTNESSVENYAHIGAEGIRDIETGRGNMETPFRIETPFFRVEMSRECGIRSIYDKLGQREVIMANHEGAFTGIYEVTPAGALPQTEARRRMGRNRCAIGSERAQARLKNVEITQSGELFVTAALDYELPGTEFYRVYLNVYKTIPLIEARVCMHKKSVWDAENVYVALPFTAGGDNITYIDKTGCVMRPGIDQLPGTNQNFYLAQTGILRQGKTRDLLITLRDAPLLAFGPREADVVSLCDGQNTQLNTAAAYSWLMNNFWETNFKVDLGGFHEFLFSLRSVEKADPATQMAKMAALNEGLIGFPIGNGK